MNTYKIKMIDQSTGEVFYVELQADCALQACRKACEDFPKGVVDAVSKI